MADSAERERRKQEEQERLTKALEHSAKKTPEQEAEIRRLRQLTQRLEWGPPKSD